MNPSLLRVQTADGWLLEGWHQPGKRALALFLHGTGSNFYSSALFDALASAFVSKHVGVLRVNTRGHDLVYSQMGKRGGAAYESVDDCRYDLDAWCDAAQKQHTPLVLVGHSLGAVKAIYSQAQQPHPAVRAVVALSPPRLSYSWFVEQAPEFLETFRNAQHHVEAGQGEQLLEVTFPLPFLSTAAGYIEKYGPQERYNILRHVSRLTVPTLVTLGGNEMSGNVAFRGLDDAVRAAHPAAQVEVFSQADHVYNGCRSPLAVCILDWLEKQGIFLEEETQQGFDIASG